MEFHSIHATTGERLATYTEATVAGIDAAVAAAVAAAPRLAALPASRRADLLERIAEELLAAGDALLQTAHAETALPLARLTGERARTVGQLRLFAALVREGSWVDARIDPALPHRTPLPRPDLRRQLQPLGPVAVFGASNFPLAYSVAGGDTASALAAGNPVVVKGHPAHPGTSELTAAAVRRAVEATAAPAGTFALVHGSRPETGLALVRHPGIEAVGFTGSLRAGRALLDAAAARPRPIPVFAEMGSVNPVFLLPGALATRPAALAEGIFNSFTLGAGQFCTKPGLVFGVASTGWETFAGDLRERAAKAAPVTFLHAGIAAAFRQAVAGIAEVEWLAQGAAPVARVRAAEFLRRPELAHEVFGPFTLLVTLDTADDFAVAAAALDGQLTAALHAEPSDAPWAAALLPCLSTRAGRLVWNGYPTGVEVSPAMQHGGPYPASTDARFTSVGTAAILRFARPVCYQNVPDPLLPPALQDANPLALLRLVDGKPSREPVVRG